MNDLNKKNVLVTGGASGIGLAAATLFLQHGANVVIAGRNAEQGASAIKQLKSDKVSFIQADIADSDSIQSLIKETIGLHGSLDIVFNNAGVEGSFTPIDETSDESIIEVIDINVKGTLLAVKYEIAQLKKQKTGGVIVNTSSWLSHGASAGSAVYSASKAALDGMIRAVAIEAAPYQIRINNVNPGYIVTPMFRRFMNPDSEAAKVLMKQAPAGRFGQPEDIAELVVWLSSPAASFITGQSILADGGLAIGGQR